MKPAVLSAVIFVSCALVMALYFFAVRPPMSAKMHELENEVAQLEGRIATIQAMQGEMPELLKSLPGWRRQLDVFATAMPFKIDDDVFLASIAKEMADSGVQLMGLELSPGGPWLGKLSEEQEQYLTDIGVDAAAAKKIWKANYSIRVNGDYASIVQALENLKLYGRMYTVDEFAAPAGGGAGAIMQMVDTARTPILISGQIYYGLPQGKVSDVEIEETLRRIESGAAPSGQQGRNLQRGRQSVNQASVGTEHAPIPLALAGAGER